MHPKDRKKIKRANLKEARSHFPHRVEIEERNLSNMKEWLIANRYRSWKQKGLMADYYTNDHMTFWFKEKDVAVHFILAMK